MCGLLIALLLGIQATSASELAVPQYPYFAYRGGNIVAVVQAGKALSKVSMLHSEEPFADSVREALNQWREDKDTLVVVNFNSGPDMEPVENGIRLSPAVRRVDCPQKNPRLPVPKLIVDPDFPGPPNIDVFGSIVVKLKISESGKVKNAEIVQGTEEYNPAVVAAVRKWEFVPARNIANVPVESEAFGICVYRLTAPRKDLYNQY